MQGFAIVKVEADNVAVGENVVQQFNEYMQRTEKAQAFVHENEGYFRVSYNESIGLSSAPIETFGNFLQSSGYRVNGIASASTLEGNDGTIVSFEKDGKEAHVTISTVRIY